MGAYHREVLKQTVILGIYFMLTYTTFLSFSCIITYIAEHEEGQYSYGPLVALAANYFTYLITLVFCTRIRDFKFQFQVSAVCHLVNYLVYIPDYKGDLGLLMGIIGALFGGYGAAIYWVSQGGYLIKLFKKYNIAKDEEGKYFGIANGIVYGSSLFGAIVTTFGLGYFGSTVYFTILSALTLVSLLVCTFFLDGLKGGDKIDSLLSEEEAPERAVKSESLLRIARDTFVKTMKYYPKMYYLVIPVILDGIISGFISVYLNKLIAEESRTNLNVGYLLMTEGVGCIIGAIASATISDKISVIKVGKIGMVLIIGTSILTFTDSLVEPATLYLPMAVSFLWGITINYLTSWESVSCAKLN